MRFDSLADSLLGNTVHTVQNLYTATPFVIPGRRDKCCPLVVYIFIVSVQSTHGWSAVLDPVSEYTYWSILICKLKLSSLKLFQTAGDLMSTLTGPAGAALVAGAVATSPYWLSLLAGNIQIQL